MPYKVARVLEIGAGLGSFGALLAQRFEYVGLEPDSESYRAAVKRVEPIGTVLNQTAETFRSSQPFDLVCAFEVLEHIEDDSRTLAGWLGHLRPGGHVLVSVPFKQSRFGAWDRKAGHYRRYDREDIVATMEQAGLSAVETITYGFPLGQIMETGRNVVARAEGATGTMEERTASSGRQLQPPTWAADATRIFSAPFRLAQRPFSTGRLGHGIVARGTL